VAKAHLGGEKRRSTAKENAVRYGVILRQGESMQTTASKGGEGMFPSTKGGREFRKTGKEAPYEASSIKLSSEKGGRNKTSDKRGFHTRHW